MPSSTMSSHQSRIGVAMGTALRGSSENVRGVDVPERFPKSRLVGAHFGLTPKRSSAPRNGAA